MWKSPTGDSALKQHYIDLHNNLLKNKPDLAKCFDVTFVEQPNVRCLDYRESIRVDKLGASINRQAMTVATV